MQGSEGRPVEHAIEHPADRSALLRAAFAALLLALTACQAPFTRAVLHEQTLQPAADAFAPETAAVEPSGDAAAVDAELEALAEPAPLTLVERISAFLVKRAPDMTPVDRARVARAIESAQRDHRVDPILVLAVIEQESRFKSDARGPRGSFGLMQVRPFVAADVAKRHGIPWHGTKTLFDPAANVQIGACYLGEMLRMYRDPSLAIAAYNLGPYRVQRLVARGRPPRPAYLTSVLKHFQALSSELGPLPEEPLDAALAE